MSRFYHFISRNHNAPTELYETEAAQQNNNTSPDRYFTLPFF